MLEPPQHKQKIMPIAIRSQTHQPIELSEFETLLFELELELELEFEFEFEVEVEVETTNWSKYVPLTYK